MDDTAMLSLIEVQARTAPCPTCGEVPTHIHAGRVPFEPPVDVLAPRPQLGVDYRLIPCGHLIDGFTVVTDGPITFTPLR